VACPHPAPPIPRVGFPTVDDRQLMSDPRTKVPPARRLPVSAATQPGHDKAPGGFPSRSWYTMNPGALCRRRVYL
jgi:hypothetical protein